MQLTLFYSCKFFKNLQELAKKICTPAKSFIYLCRKSENECNRHCTTKT